MKIVSFWGPIALRRKRKINSKYNVRSRKEVVSRAKIIIAGCAIVEIVDLAQAVEKQIANNLFYPMSCPGESRRGIINHGSRLFLLPRRQSRQILNLGGSLQIVKWLRDMKPYICHNFKWAFLLYSTNLNLKAQVPRLWPQSRVNYVNAF